MLVCLVQEARSLDPLKDTSQYIQELWGVEKGFTGGTIYAVAQTSDGYLWIGTDRGLVRFDGLEFKYFQIQHSDLDSIEPVTALLADDHGTLWIQLVSRFVFRYHNGVFENVLINSQQVKTLVCAMTRAKNGDILLSTVDDGVLRYDGESFRLIIPKTKMPDSVILSIAETSNGDIWLGTRDRGLFRYDRIAGEMIGNEMPESKVNCLVPTSNGELLIGTDKGGVQWDGHRFYKPETLNRLQDSQIIGAVEDRDSNLWISTNSHGVWRINNQKTGGMATADSQVSGKVTSISEDREGNLWFGTTDGIVRVRDGAFTTFSKAQGLPDDNNGPIFVDDQNRTWFAPTSGGLYVLKDNQVRSVPVEGLQKDIVYSISGDDDGLWIGRRNGGLTHVSTKGMTFLSKTYTEKDGLAQNSVSAVYKARDGTIWAGTLTAGVCSLKDGKFSKYTTMDGLPLNTINAMAESSAGTMWFATPAGLGSFDGKRWQTFTNTTGLPSNIVNTLFFDSGGILWVGTEKGLAFIDSDNRAVAVTSPKSLDENILGIAQDHTDSIWVATAVRVVRAARNGLLSNALSDTDIRQYDSADGLKSVEGIRRTPSVVRDAESRIWFSLNRGISMVDPSLLAKLSAPALVHIQNFVAGNTSLDLNGPITVVTANQNIKIGFIALGLPTPERTRYRYKLDGFDVDWSEPTRVTERIYSNLSPGNYTFHVISTNNEGLWNSSEATIQFKVTPVFWQTFWFQGLCLLAFGFIIICLFRLRIYQLKLQMNRRFEERLAERTRIAQDLHDTLLQGFVSAKMQLFAEVHDLSPEAPKTKRLEGIYQDLGQLIEGARKTVRDLRASEYDKFTDFEQEFVKIREGFDINKNLDFRMIVRGTPRPLHPLVGSELLHIGHEALINAFLHSHATAIEMEIEYGLGSLKLLVRDNGCGIDDEILRSGREGHWGLSGMHERAEKIKAEIKILSRVNAGTEVVVSVPRRFAFKNTGSFPNWIRELIPFKSPNKSE